MNTNLVFIDTEFTPASKRWLSLGAVVRDRFFYAETNDQLLLEFARREFSGNLVGEAVLGQLGSKQFPPGGVRTLAEMGRLFADWMHKTVGLARADLCYDYSHDMALLEQALAKAGIRWPNNWHPCNLAILNEDEAAEAAKRAVWAEFEATRGLRQHHALADAAALQAAYAVQSAS